METIYRICKEAKLCLEDNTVDFDIAKHSVTVYVGCYRRVEMIGLTKGDSSDSENELVEVDHDRYFYLEFSGAGNVTYVLRKLMRQYCIPNLGHFSKEDSTPMGSSKWVGISVRGLPDILRQCINKGFFVASSPE